MCDDAWLAGDDPLLGPLLAHVTPGCRGLWFAGSPDALVVRPRIGIIGSRTPRVEAASLAHRIATDAARAGLVVVSGLARGIDGIAHEAALAAGAPTIAVLGGGLDRVQPATNRDLARSIAGSSTRLGVCAGPHPDARGLVLSEYGVGAEEALPYRFQERNRVIAALSDYLVVVQARHRSGSMGTARHALELGVPIGVVPSAPDDDSYSGAIGLIHDGADAVVDGASLFRRLEAHGIMRPGFADAARRGAVIDPADPRGWTGGGEHQQLPLFDHPLADLLRIPRTADDLAVLAGMALRDARMLLLDLEEDGFIRHADDGTWIAVAGGS